MADIGKCERKRPRLRPRHPKGRRTFRTAASTISLHVRLIRRLEVRSTRNKRQGRRQEEFSSPIRFGVDQASALPAPLVSVMPGARHRVRCRQDESAASAQQARKPAAGAWRVRNRAWHCFPRRKSPNAEARLFRPPVRSPLGVSRLMLSRRTLPAELGRHHYSGTIVVPRARRMAGWWTTPEEH